VDENSVAPRAPYVLRRARSDGTEEPIDEYPTFEAGWRAGTRAVTVEDREHAYALYHGDRRVARFGFRRLMVRFDVERLSSEPLLGAAS
jgi:hypothetical protein